MLSYLKFSQRSCKAEIANHVIIIGDTHYGRVEDVQMSICHLLRYAFMENSQGAK